MKGLLLRVGIDKGTGGCLGPIFQDRTFEYIPIPETRPTSENNVYIKMKGRYGRDLTEFMPNKYWYSQPHHDPEFTTYTYGDPSFPKRNQLSKLKPGDLLIFYAGLEPENSKNKSQLFVIGYFDIEKVYDFKEIQKLQYGSVFREVPNNAHSKIYFRLKELGTEYLDDNLIIIKGNSRRSKLFTKALPIGDSEGKLIKKLKFGYEGSLQRAIGHSITEEHIIRVKEWLEKGES
jgi:hypothetical protein